MDKVVLGLSGGVDSAVAAHLLRKSGLEVYGLYLDNGLPGADAAREAAASLFLPLTIVDSREAMEKHVCAPFAEAYLRGETPNPCILCNPAVKFRALLDEAKRLRRGDCVRLTGTLVAESKNYFCVGEVETLERISEKDLYPLKKK